MLKPIKSNVIVELIEKEKVTSSGIVLSSADPAEANRGKVLSVGPNVDFVKEGDIVLPNWNAARKTKYENTDLFIVDENEIVLIFGE
ncbi:co-chaperone GroES [bacterium]|nr:co-chaperone GroES [Candidatus Elulimicrobium humile]